MPNAACVSLGFQTKTFKMPKVQLKKQKLNNNNIGRKRIQAKRKIMNKMGEKLDISLKK